MTKLICGVDEAGRGPVLGPLVMAGILIKEEDLPKLTELGVKDSKLLTKEKREELFPKIKKLSLNHEIRILPPSEIDQSLSNPSTNLNWLEADTSALIVNILKPDKAILDCPSPNISAYVVYFLNRLDSETRSKTEVIAEHKADLNYVVVGAASILAKVTRDRELEKLKKKHKINFGSGYLTDELTTNFLKENFDKKEYSELFRKGWAPYKDLVRNKDQKKLGEF